MCVKFGKFYTHYIWWWAKIADLHTNVCKTLIGLSLLLLITPLDDQKE